MGEVMAVDLFGLYTLNPPATQLHPEEVSEHKKVTQTARVQLTCTADDSYKQPTYCSPYFMFPNMTVQPKHSESCLSQ